jgi:hypothetical protein
MKEEKGNEYINKEQGGHLRIPDAPLNYEIIRLLLNAHSPANCRR